MAVTDDFTPEPAGLGHHEAIGQSPAFLDFQERLRLVAPIERPVLLIGDRGTGKEMAAQRLHFLSGRWGQPFITLNCSALSPSLIESELFGHEAGAFTGARGRRAGRFESANGGSLFLDELSLIPLETQEKILRVVEYGAFERVGGTDHIRVDVRIIGATNADLPALVKEGRFKNDLLDRLSFEVLFLPPLRERGEDILLLARHFAARMAYEIGREATPEFTDRAARQLSAHPWPGNVRELKNVVERAVYLCPSDRVDRIDFHPFRSPYGPEPDAAGARARKTDGGGGGAGEPAEWLSEIPDGLATEGANLPMAVRAVELHFLRRALRLSRYNQRVAAEALGITYHQFRGLYRKYSDELKDNE